MPPLPFCTMDSMKIVVLDVVSVEPIKSDNPLLKAKNCIVTPHIAWASLATRQRLMQSTAENIRAFQAGKPMNVINP